MIWRGKPKRDQQRIGLIVKFSSRAFTMLIQALMHSGTRPKTMTVDLGDRVVLDPAALHMERHKEDEVRKALERLEIFDLSFGKIPHHYKVSVKERGSERYPATFLIAVRP